MHRECLFGPTDENMLQGLGNDERQDDRQLALARPIRLGNRWQAMLHGPQRYLYVGFMCQQAVEKILKGV